MLALRLEKRRRQTLARAGELRAAAERSLAEFARQAWPILEPATPLVWGWHMDAICEHLEAVSSREIANLAIEVPPGCSKSTIASVCWPAWHWCRRAADRFITASYALNLAIRDALRCRRVIESPWYQAAWGDRSESPRFVLAGDQNVKSRYENDRTGYRISASVDSGTTGERGTFTLIDDAHNVREAESKTVREATLHWHDEAFWNRVNDATKGGRVIIGQRVHTDDLIGHVLQQPGFVELRVPEEYEEKRHCTTSIGWSDPRQAEGDLMRPERFGPTQVKEAKARLGNHAYQAQHQQNPTPREGSLFKRAWWVRYNWRTDHYVVCGTGEQIFPAACKRVGVMDPAGGVSEGADHTAICFWDVLPDRRAALRHAFRGRIPVEEIPKKLLELCLIHRPLYVLVEGAFLQSAIVRESRKLRGMPAVRQVDPGGKSKFVRATPAIVKAEARELLVPADGDNPWIADWLAEHDVFTGVEDARDDLVDTTAYVCLDMQNGVGGGEPMSLGRKAQ